MTLRIQRSTERKLVVLRLAGRIQADQLQDIEALLQSESSDGQITLDLGGVKLVDRDAVRFLAECAAKGTKLINCAAYIREWISRETDATQTNGRSSRDGSGE